MGTHLGRSDGNHNFAGLIDEVRIAPVAVYPGIVSDHTGSSCLQLLEASLSTGSGVLNDAGPGAEYLAYCDMETAGGGWTMVIRLNTNDGDTRSYAVPFWMSTVEVGSIFDQRDYLSPAYDGLTDGDQLMLDYRYTDQHQKRMATVFEGTNGLTLRGQTTQTMVEKDRKDRGHP